jgi:tRNA (guanosine-2'-O-)-methyltransferase
VSELKRPRSASEFLLDERRQRVDEVVAARTRALLVVLDRLGDSFNQAAVLRTCEGLGVLEVHVVKHAAAGFQPHPGVTQGCEKWLDLVFHDSPLACAEALKARGYALWVSALGGGAEPLPSLRFDRKVALVFGNECTGVHPDMQALAELRFWIPMSGFSQSFNVSVAVATTVSRALFWREEHLSRQGDLSPQEQAELKERYYRLSLKHGDKIYPREGG